MKRTASIFLRLLIAAAVFPSGSAWAVPNYAGVTYGKPRTEYIRAGDARFNTVDITLPKNRAPGVKSPTIVLFHGGGFTNGDKNDPEMVRLAESLADQGFVVFNANYRLASGTADPKAGYPAPAAYEDADLMNQFMRTHAEEYGIDREMITALGYSAGGPIAAHLGLTGPKDTRASLVVSIAGRMDFNRPAIGSDSRKFFMPYGDYNRFSPLLEVSPESSPFLFFHDIGDLQVEVQHSEIMYRALRALGLPAELIYADGAVDHATIVDWVINNRFAYLADAVRARLKSVFFNCAGPLMRAHP